jgi:hypothetical protein
VCESVLWDAKRSRIWSKHAHGSYDYRTIASIAAAYEMIDNAVLRFPDEDSSKVGIDALELWLNSLDDVPHSYRHMPRPIALDCVDLRE